jgi:hypothetical protein
MNSGAPKQLPMVGWYDPKQLLRSAQEVAVSTLFGRHSDYRLIESLALSTMQPNEHDEIAESDEFWFDCVADTGDGWNPTYAIAYTIVQPTLRVRDPRGHEHLTQRGSVLVFAGDQVYPAASRTEYRQRLVAP